jgi:hypothetical protein
MMTEHDVALTQGGANSHGDRFLPSPKMGRSAHFLVAITLGQKLFGQSHIEKTSMQIKLQLRAQ